MARNTTRHCRSPMTRHNSDVSSNSERKIKRGRKSFSDPLFLDSTLIFSRYFSAPISSRISSHAWLITTRKIYVQLIGRFKIIIRSSNLSFLANIRVNIFPSSQCKRYSTSLSDGSRHRDVIYLRNIYAFLSVSQPILLANFQENQTIRNCSTRTFSWKICPIHANNLILNDTIYHSCL